VACPGEDTLVAWIEHELEASARVELEDHVDGCAHCRTTVGHLAATGDDLANVPAAIGRYVPVRRLGAGGMGVVWLAHDPELDRRVALKVLRADATATDDQLRREARVMASLHHPHVVPVYDIATADGHVFVTMEYVEGTTLRGWLAERPRHWREVLDVCVKAGRGLAAAHAAGIVHRDFKPDNVLCGGDRVLVADFGLAQLRDEPARQAPRAPELASALVTRTGHRLGTLRYMAPEQLRDGITDARSDQWSLGVTLYEALYGVLPFDTSSLEQLLASIRHARVRPPPSTPRVPKTIRRAIQRCLAADPVARFPSIDALLAELASELPTAVRRRRLRIAGGAAAGVAILGATIAYRQIAHARDPEVLCARGAERIDDAWDDARRAAVHQAWAAAKVPYAEDVWLTVDRTLSDRASAWRTTFREACVAARVRGTRSEAALDRQMACLDRRGREVRALADDLARPTSVDHAASAATAVGDPSGCSELDALATVDPPPPGLAARVTRESIELELARATAASALWRFSEAADVLARLEPRARAFGYRPLLADVLLAEGRARGDAGDVAPAIALLRDAVWFAEASHSDETAAHGLLELEFDVASRQLHFDEAIELLHRAEAAVERAGRTPRLLGQLARNRAELALKRGRFDEAAAHYGEAVRILRPVLGDPSAELADLLGAEAVAYEQLGRYDEARARYEAVLRIQHQLLGGSHPQVATTLQSLGIVDETQGRYKQGVERQTEALAILNAALGPRHPLVAQAHDELANAYYEAADGDRALAEHQQAIDLASSLLGPEHPTTARYLANRAMVLSHLGHRDEACATLRHVLAIELSAFGPQHPRAAETQLNLASLLLQQDHPREALPLLDAALATLERTRERGHPQIATALLDRCLVHEALGEHAAARADADAVVATARGAIRISALQCQGDAMLGLGQAEPARDILQQALALATDEPQADDSDRAEIRFALARALWATGDRAHAVALAKDARRHVTGDDVRVRVDRWLATHAP
jgi:tetratricopeptide (TPR) repeat protein/predicted Ser/Thr protein kinase